MLRFISSTYVRFFQKVTTFSFCKWKVNFSWEAKILLDIFVLIYLPFCSINLLPFFTQHHDSAFKKVLIFSAKKSFKDNSISSSVVKFSKLCNSDTVCQYLEGFSTIRWIFMQRFFSFSEFSIAKYNESVPFWFSILKPTLNKQLLTKSCIFFY